MASDKVIKKEKPYVDDQGNVSDEAGFIDEALARFEDTNGATTEIRMEMLSDILFKSGQHWPADLKDQREATDRPALSTNLLLNYINHVSNNVKQNLPGLKFNPVDSINDPATANVISGSVRHIMAQGDSKDAMGWAFDGAVSGGLGFFSVRADYSNDDSFDQEICLERIDNAASVYMPIHLCNQPDFSDAPYCFVRTKMSKVAFEEKYPKEDSLPHFEKSGMGDAGWITDDGVYVAEYFYVKETYKTLYQLEDGSKVFELSKGQIAAQERRYCDRKVFRFIISENGILKEPGQTTDGLLFPSKYIPIIAVCGQEINVNGKKKFISLTRMMKDPQKMNNYYESTFTEIVAAAPRAPFMAEEGQLEGHIDEWKEMNTRPQAVLLYKGRGIDGQMIPPPQRIQPPAIGDAIIKGIELARESMKNVCGIFDASLGARSNERSGTALMQRDKQSDNATYHFTDNFQRSIRYLGKIFIDMIPKIYDTSRMVAILGEDMVEDIVRVNEHYADPENPGQSKIYDMRAGKYAVVVTTGPAFETKKQESLQLISQLLPAVPQIGQIGGDVIVSLMDMGTPGITLASRLKKMLPPGVADDPIKQGQQVSPEQLKAIIGDMQKLMAENQMHTEQKQQMGQLIGQLQKELKDKSAEQQLKMDSVVIKASTELKKAQLVAHQADSHKAIDTAMQLHQMSQPRPAVSKSNKGA